MMTFYNIFLEHPQSTSEPQGYWSHFLFSVVNSFKGVWFMLLGIIHGFLPILFPFSTSSFFIKTFVKLVQSDRHQGELRKYIDEEILNDITSCIR